MSKIRLSLPLAALFSLPFTTQADTLKTAPVVVTATRIAQTADQALVPVTVINREAIEKSPARDLPDLLKLQPGIDLFQSGGVGGNTSLFMRGTSTRQVLVLIDGVRIGSATLGQASLEDLPLAQIERIEIVRGPRSSLYGSDAVGGVIQVFTRQGKDGFQPRASLAYGTHDRRELTTGLSGGDETQRFNLNLSRTQTDGIDALDVGGNDDDGYRNDNISARYQRQLTDRTSLDLSWLRTDSKVAFDSSSSSAEKELDESQQVLNARLNQEITNNWDLMLQAGESRDRSQEETDGVDSGRFDTRNRQLELQSNHYLGDDQILTWGLSHAEQQVESSTAYDDDERTVNAGFGQWQNRWSDLELMLGLRTDDYDDFGRHNTGNVSSAYHLDGTNKVLLSYGTAFLSPTFNQLYFPSFGNPNLKPEESRTWEIGFEHRRASLSWAVRAFRTRIDELIGGFPVKNIDKAAIDGLELEWQARLDTWQLSASASFLDAVNEETDKVLQSRAERTLQLQASRDFGKLNASLSLVAQGHRFTDADNNNRLAGYGLTSVGLGYELDPSWRVSAKVNNLFDKEYATNTDFSGAKYNTLGRTLMVGVDYGI